MLGDDRVERLVPAEGMRGHDRGIVAPDDRNSSASSTPARNLIERREAVHQEMALTGRDLRAREHADGSGGRGELGQLLVVPLIVVLRDHQAVQADFTGSRPGPAGR